MSQSHFRSSVFFRILSAAQIFVLSVFFVLPSGTVQAQTFSVFSLPKPGTIVSPSEQFVPPLLKGISLHKENPLVFDFIVDPGNSDMSSDAIQKEGQKLVKYFLASLTIPDKDLWVNLSPYENNKIIPQEFGLTEMGRDLLAQDYILKQLSASMIYPEKDLGKDFWNRVYKKAVEKYGTTDIPMSTFNKVWIVPHKAVVVETKDAAYVVESHLKVLMEQDYIAIDQSRASEILGPNRPQENEFNEVSTISSELVREIIIPEIEKEVNEGKNFSQLRQIYHALILASWFKDNLKNNILNEIYSNQAKILGVDVADRSDKEKIYQQYLAAYRQGVFNYIKEDLDPSTGEPLPRKYFSGGFAGENIGAVRETLSLEDFQRLGGTSASFENPDGKAVLKFTFAMTGVGGVGRNVSFLLFNNGKQATLATFAKWEELRRFSGEAYFEPLVNALKGEAAFSAETQAIADQLGWQDEAQRAILQEIARAIVFEDGSNTAPFSAAGAESRPADRAMQSDLKERLTANASIPQVVRDNIAREVITEQAQGEILERLVAIGEINLLAGWEAPGVNDDQKIAALNQLIELDRNYSGGLASYKDNVRILLESSKKGANPFEGFGPKVPSGQSIPEIGQEFSDLSEEGLKVANKSAYVIVAGGVGDRLGYRGIKVGIVSDLVTNRSYLQTYAESILALQNRSNEINGESRRVPFIIMTSNDTHDLTVRLLEENNYFGMDGLSINPTSEEVRAGNVNQIIVLKQGAVPAVKNNNADFVLDEQNPYRFQEKPHGHGDIHMLIKQADIQELFATQGITHTVFFQDTNGQVFNVIPAGLGNSVRNNFAMNFLTVPRGAGEAAGAIVEMSFGQITREGLQGAVANADQIWNALEESGLINARGVLTDKFKIEGRAAIVDAQLFGANSQAVYDFLQSNQNNNSQTFNVEYNELGPFLTKNAQGRPISAQELESVSAERANEVFERLKAEGYINEGGFVTDKFKRGEALTTPAVFADYGEGLAEKIHKFILAHLGDVADPSTGKSPFPGNMNVFIVENGVYGQKLNETGGIFGEFINPKYSNPEKTQFKPTRAETMMQDYAKSLPGNQVGFTNFDRLMAFSPVKNSMSGALDVVKKGNAADAMPTGESDRYKYNRNLLARAGVTVNVAGEQRLVHGIPITEGARVIFSPRFAVTPADVQNKIKGGSITNNSVVLLDGTNIRLENADINGTLRIRAVDNARVTVQGSINNQGSRFVELTAEEMAPGNTSVPEYLKIRGYRVEVVEETSFNFTEEGDYQIRGATEVYRLVEGAWIPYTPPVNESAETGESSTVVKETPLGGIDLNPARLKIEVNKENGGLQIEFDPQILEAIRQQGIEGFVPVIINIQPIKSALPLLSQGADESQIQTASI